MMIEKTGGSYPQKDNGKLALANRRWRAGNLSAVTQIPLAIKFSGFLNRHWRCPRCGTRSVGYPALSRTDNATNICSECGTMEALEQFGDRLLPQSKWAKPRSKRTLRSILRRKEQVSGPMVQPNQKENNDG